MTKFNKWLKENHPEHITESSNLYNKCKCSCFPCKINKCNLCTCKKCKCEGCKCGLKYKNHVDDSGPKSDRGGSKVAHVTKQNRK